MEIIKQTYGRLYTKGWVEFDLVLEKKALFQIGDDEIELDPGSVMYIGANRQYNVSAPVRRFQVRLSYFDENDFFDSRIMQDIGGLKYVAISPLHQPGKAIIAGLSTIYDLQEKESASLAYLESGILYSILETFQIFLRKLAAQNHANQQTNLKTS